MNENKISERSLLTPPSFIRGILKATENEEVISFAGGLPNPISFPKEALKESTQRVIDTFGSKVFQYASTAGLLPLRECIANRLNSMYRMEITAEDILITTGSQQALDLIGKVLINKGDAVIIEQPGYLGAIQAFSQYQPQFMPIPIESDGMDMNLLEQTLKQNKVKFAYIVPNYQNPSGLTYSDEKRKEVLALTRKYDCILVEDDPYGELSFDGKPKGYISAHDLEGSILLGTFSKTVTPGMRLGFMIIKDAKLRKYMNTAKEAADLHSNIFSQYIIWDYMTHNNINEHIVKIRDLYKEQCQAMLDAMSCYFPKEVTYTKPSGGMFIWATLPQGKSAMSLFEKAKAEKVAFVPGNPFYTDGREANTMRLNYTNSSPEMIKEGIARMGKILIE
ncbi:MAG: PLP-dependent aminotransferase family protein [Cellulosilyticum sp.]|nr:PLP-dependent aminotransferase family protein [Cellulosilyticum sp.]